MPSQWSIKFPESSLQVANRSYDSAFMKQSTPSCNESPKTIAPNLSMRKRTLLPGRVRFASYSHGGLRAGGLGRDDRSVPSWLLRRDHMTSLGDT